MYFYVTLTLNCNMQCRYCYGKCIESFGQPFPFEVDDSLPSHIIYDIAKLAEFLKMDKDPTIIFYGGEPTLALDKMQEIMDSVSAKEWIIQTNGSLLDRLEPSYANKFHTILVSIDGDEALTDYYRGNGTYRRVIENLELLRNRGFRGEIIARMTVGPETDIRQAVNWLLLNQEFPFEAVHWQLDAQFWISDYERKSIERWFEEYNLGVRSLAMDWVSYIEKTGKVMRIYPFVALTESLLSGRSTKLRCGAGWTEFNIQTDGNITPCPVMAGIKDFYLGNIWETKPRSLRDAVFVGDPCPQCSVFELCGGRCLYANSTKLWGEEGYRLVCGTVENLVNSLKAVQSRIHDMIRAERIAKADFDYPKYNSCEMIP